MGKKNEFDEIQDEARKEFSLRDRLAGISQRRATVTVYTDAATGALLGVAEDEKDQFDLKTGRRTRRGLLGEMDALIESTENAIATIKDDPDAVKAATAALDKEQAALTRKITAAQKKLDSTALVFTLQTLPDIIIRDARRKARKELGLKAKSIPEDRLEDFTLEHVAQLVSASVSEWTDKQTGEKHAGLTVSQARDLRDYLPRGQFDRLDHAVAKLSFEAAISNSVTDSADF